MPIYEYRCHECRYQFELLSALDDPAAVNCPQCGGPTKRLLSAGTGIIIKSGNNPGKTVRGRNREGCDRSSPCCGADVPCEKPPCNE